jgi:Leucine-rich repeat (LRR) protein
MENLYNTLLEAYSDENLNRITGKLIDLYKNRNYPELRNIANKISKYVVIDEEKDVRCFSRLIMLYHPDRGEFYRNLIRESFFGKNEESLEQHSHILIAGEIEHIKVEHLPEDDDIDYNPEYIWEEPYDSEYGFHRQDFSGEDDEQEPEEIEKSFYNAVKLREFGHLEVYYPTWYLRDLEEFEMEFSGITSLFGIEHLKHVVLLDLSNNELTDIADLWNLTRLEELYLANNEIGYIDVLSNLQNLRILDLSGNQIDDISPLFELQHLEYLNLIGNKIPKKQIEHLKKRDIILMC